MCAHRVYFIALHILFLGMPFTKQVHVYKIINFITNNQSNNLCVPFIKGENLRKQAPLHLVYLHFEGT